MRTAFVELIGVDMGRGWGERIGEGQSIKKLELYPESSRELTRDFW